MFNADGEDNKIVEMHAYKKCEINDVSCRYRVRAKRESKMGSICKGMSAKRTELHNTGSRGAEAEGLTGINKSSRTGVKA